MAQKVPKLCCRQERSAEGEETAQMIRDAGGQATFVQGDITSGSEVQKMIQTCVDEYGRIDIACNNAGIEGNLGLLTDCSEEDFDRVIDINVKGTWRCMQTELNQMIAQGDGGVIVNIGSVASVIGFPMASAYSASKHAMIGLTKTAAQENAPHNIRVNIVCPALIETEMADRFTGGRESETEQFIMTLTQMRRRGTVDEVADAVQYLSGDQSTYVTGHSLIIDGGATTI